MPYQRPSHFCQKGLFNIFLKNDDFWSVLNVFIEEPSILWHYISFSCIQYFQLFCVYSVLSIILEIGEVEHGVVVHGCGLDEVSPLGTHNLFIFIIFFIFITFFCIFFNLVSLFFDVRLLLILVTSSLIHHRLHLFYTLNILYIARTLSIESLIAYSHSAELPHCSFHSYFHILFHHGYFLILVCF